MTWGHSDGLAPLQTSCEGEEAFLRSYVSCTGRFCGDFPYNSEHFASCRDFQREPLPLTNQFNSTLTWFLSWKVDPEEVEHAIMKRPPASLPIIDRCSFQEHQTRARCVFLYCCIICKKLIVANLSKQGKEKEFLLSPLCQAVCML